MASRVSVSPIKAVLDDNPDIGGQRQLGAASQGNAVDCGNDRFVQVFNGGKQISNGQNVFLDLGRAQGGPFLQVRAGAKCFFARAGNNDNTDIRA